MSAPDISPVFTVEVTETTTTRYRVRAADADRAQDVATNHNIDEGSEGSSTDGAVEFWQTVDLADTDASGQDMAWLALNESLADHRRLAGQISAASEACDTALLTSLEMDQVDYLKRVRDAAEGVRRG